jgi:hypothetical protein
MTIKQGNTYQLKGTIKGVEVSEIQKIVFKFNDLKKIYTTEIGETSDVTYEDGVFTIPLSQAETLELKGDVKYEIAVKFNDNQVKRSVVNSTGSLYTIIEEVI